MVATTDARNLTTLDAAATRDFRDRLAGEALRPGDAGYDAARRVWNAMIDRHPALIVRCAGAGGVQTAVDFARERQLPLSIRGGGHNVSGNGVADGAVMVDCSRMKRIEIDPVSRTARAHPGVTWSEFDSSAAEHGLATVGGTVDTTGIAGLTLGGGQGWLTGKYGLTIDNRLSVELVTATGKLVRASADEHPDLFWAMRGAGANFGVATEFVYQLHPVTFVFGGMVIHPLDRARDVLRFYREFAPGQPDELTTYAALLSGPDGSPVVALVACYAGPAVDAEHALAPLRGFGRPVADTFAEIPYLTMQGMLGPSFPDGRRNYWKTGLTNVIADDVIEATIDAAHGFPTPWTAIAIGDCHGASRRVPSADTAYPHRDLQFDYMIQAAWDDAADDDRNIGWVRRLHATVEPHLGAGIYVNDLAGDGGVEAVRRAYASNYPRLVELKPKYDPDNLFRFNQNIAP